MREYIVALPVVDDRLKEILAAGKEARGIIDFSLGELGMNVSSASLIGLVKREIEDRECSFSLIKVLDPNKSIERGCIVEFRHVSSGPLLATCAFLGQAR